jgi:hypothetical protein
MTDALRDRARYRSLARTLVAAVIAATVAAPSAADAAPLYFGKSADGRARVRLTYLSDDTRARIRLAPRPAARVAERLVRLACGSGNYGREALVTLRWPKGKRLVEVGAGRVIGGVDRCRVTSKRRLSIRMSMHRR